MLQRKNLISSVTYGGWSGPCGTKVAFFSRKADIEATFWPQRAACPVAKKQTARICGPLSSGGELRQLFSRRLLAVVEVLRQILNANPLEDIRNSRAIDIVVKNGRLYDANTLNEIWPRHRLFEQPWFAGDAPEKR